jgi:two-component system, NarL family, sensor kinase
MVVAVGPLPDDLAIYHRKTSPTGRLVGRPHSIVAGELDGQMQPAPRRRALSQQVDRLGRQGLSISLHAPAALPVLPAAVEVAAYRILTEALTNITRHAHAHQITITVAIDGDLCLAVHDDGTTSTANGDRWRPGVGLLSMAERVAEVGGTLQAGPTPTGGRVQATLPLELP